MPSTLLGAITPNPPKRVLEFVMSTLALVIFATYPVNVRPAPPPIKAAVELRVPGDWRLDVDTRVAKVKARSGALLCSAHRYSIDATAVLAMSVRAAAGRRMNLTDASENVVGVVVDAFEPSLLWKNDVALLWATPQAFVAMSGTITVMREGRVVVAEPFTIERGGTSTRTLNTCDAGSGALARAIEAAQAELVEKVDHALDRLAR